MTTTPAFSNSLLDPDPDADVDPGFTTGIATATRPAQELAEVLAGGQDTGQDVSQDVGGAWGHTGSSVDCPGCTYRCEAPESHNWGCPCAPHGPGAARQVAEYLTAQDLHAHLVVDGHDICVSGHCEVPEPTLAGTLL